jgi:ABC-type antimicrobial peptide transport system permease subunit
MMVFGPLEFGDRPGVDAKPSMITAVDAWPGYFETAGIRLLEGRGLQGGDLEGAAVVSEGFARRHWPDRSPLGMRFRAGRHPWRVVVGVANEVRSRGGSADDPEFEVYYPPDQVSGVMVGMRPLSRIAEFVTIVIRSPEPDAVSGRLAGLVHDVDSRVVVSDTVSVAREMADEIARPRLVFLMMGIFAAGALLLVAAGLYGVLAHLVAERRREIGVRLALGASPRDVGRAVVRNGFAMVGVGLAAGLGAALLLVDAMRSLLYEVEPSDPGTAAMVVVVIAATGAIAVWRPARQAMRVDPVALLRNE